MKPIYNVLIIGAGKIGAFFDTPGSQNVISHAHGFSKNDNFKLIGFYDNDIEKAKKASDVWGGEVFLHLDDAFCNKIDVVCIAVPDEYHYETFMQLADKRIKLIFAEKPLARSMKEADEILKIFKNREIPILVNYTRRFIPEFENIKKDISTGEYGEYITGSGFYGKGLLHNGSHAIDFLRYMIGEITEIKALNYKNDFYENDPSISVILSFGYNKYFTLQQVDSNAFTIFETDLLFERKRIRIINSGALIEIYEVEESETLKGYKYIKKVSEMATSDDVAMQYAVKNIYEHLAERDQLKCTATDAYKAMDACLKMKEGLEC